VQVFGEDLGHLDREAVLVEVILVAVLSEPFAGGLRGTPPHRHDLQGEDVALLIGDIADEIGDAEATPLRSGGNVKRPT
jgi:hypothetical protein